MSAETPEQPIHVNIRCLPNPIGRQGVWPAGFQREMRDGSHNELCRREMEPQHLVAGSEIAFIRRGDGLSRNDEDEFAGRRTCIDGNSDPTRVSESQKSWREGLRQGLFPPVRDDHWNRQGNSGAIGLEKPKTSVDLAPSMPANLWTPTVSQIAVMPTFWWSGPRQAGGNSLPATGAYHRGSCAGVLR